MTRRCAEVIGEIHRMIERELIHLRRQEGRALNLLDIGCWDGEITARYRQVLGGWARGLEIFAAPAAVAASRGIEVAIADLEAQALPWPDESVDVVVANQVFEHLKNVWFAMSEVARLVVPGGFVVFSVPNLASLHNRVLLALGIQPSSIRTFGPHVRGFTYRQACQFVEYGGFFRVERATGVGFYPLPARWSALPARLWIGASHTPVLIARRVAGSGADAPWRAMMTGEEIGEQTFYSAPATRR